MNNRSYFLTLLLIGTVLLIPVSAKSHPGHVDTEIESDANAEISTDNRSDSPDQEGGGIEEEGKPEQGENNFQDRTTPRSNQPENAPDALDEDDDGDGVPLPIKEIDKASPKIYEGINIQVCDGNGDCDDADDGVGPPGLHVAEKIRLNVDAQSIRGLSQESRIDIERYSEIESLSSANEFGMFVASQALQNEDIKSISVEEEGVKVTYNTKIKVLGLFSKQVEAVGEVDSNGQMKVSYPWYGFLSTKTENEAVMSIAQRIFNTNANMDISVEEEGAPRNIREEE